MPTIIDGTTGVDQVQDGIITDAKIATMATSKLTGRVAAANAPLGSVIQVVSVTKTDTFSIGSTTFTDITGLSASITPSSATSKIMVFVVVNGSVTFSSNQMHLRLMRDSTAIAIGDAAGSRTRSSAELALNEDTQSSASINFLDSPSTTSATTYKVQVRTVLASPTAFINRRQGDTDNDFRSRTLSTITIMEIAA